MIVQMIKMTWQNQQDPLIEYIIVLVYLEIHKCKDPVNKTKQKKKYSTNCHYYYFEADSLVIDNIGRYIINCNNTPLNMYNVYNQQRSYSMIRNVSQLLSVKGKHEFLCCNLRQRSDYLNMHLFYDHLFFYYFVLFYVDNNFVIYGRTRIFYMYVII